VVHIPLEKLGGHRDGFTVLDPRGREVPWQAGSGELLFPASLIPGELPEFQVGCCDSRKSAPFHNQIILRKVGMNRVELGNSRFRMVIDTSVPAIIEAYSLSCAAQRTLNYVETSPESDGALKGDIHESEKTAAARQPDIAGENTGWTGLDASGPMTGVELAETGPLRGRLILRREAEIWQLTWTAGSPAIHWKARRGFRFAAVSASPYLPFNRFLGGSEYNWPNGPGESEPPDNDIRPRSWSKLPGGHVVYYQQEENYGALGIVAIDPDLVWTGIGSRRFLAQKPEGDAEIVITFPEWRGQETVLEARKENRVVRQPVLVQVSPGAKRGVSDFKPAEREQEYEAKTGDAVVTPFHEDSIPLGGDWELAWAEKGAGPPTSGWKKVKVPGSVHTQWLDPAKVFAREAEWISYREWWYRRSFRVPERFGGKRLWLQFDATDYYADTYLNGESLGRHEGYIDPYAYEVTDKVHAGAENQLAVRVWTPVDYYWKHRPYTVKGSYGAVDQKPDDITPLGITRPVRLLAAESAVITDVAVATRLVGSGAEVEVELEAEGLEGEGEWELTLAPQNFSSPDRYQVRARVLGRQSRLVIPVRNPQLWWTWDHGKPNLYKLDIRLLDPAGRALDGRSLAVGIREIEKIGWNFYLNHRRMFIRGTNYYYHLFMSEMDRVKYERDVKLMLGMNVNLIRIHCHFSNPEFYDLADEYGVLVWQDFLEAWYPHDTGFSVRAAALYDNHIKYVRNHPSVALWATSDEEDLENYRDLTKHLAPRLFLYDPQHRPVVRSTGRYGDSHIYYGWYGGSIWEYTKMNAAFVSELGATSLPNYPTLIKFMPNHWPIKDHAEEWVWRRLQIPEAMRAWGDPGGKSLEEYIPQTQAYVARLFQIALERQRRRKSEGAGGILHFHAIDIWPSVTMAAIDFERVPTKVYDTVRRSFAPVGTLFEYDRDKWKSGDEFRCGVWAVNDSWDTVPGAAISWQIRDEAGKALQEGKWSVSMASDSVQKLGDASWTAAKPGLYELRTEMRDPKGSLISDNIFQFEIVAAN